MYTDILLSSEFSIIVGGEVLTFCTDASLEINKETIDATKLASAGWKEKIVNLKEYGVSFNGMVTRGEAINSFLWLASKAYVAGNFVIMGGKCYEAQGATTGNNPGTDGGANWLEVSDYAGGTTYPAGELVYIQTVAEELRIYKSLQAGNIGNEPTASPTYWERIDIGAQAILNDIFNNNLPVKIMLKSDQAGTTYYYGTGFLTSYSKSITTGDKSTFSGKFESSGGLETALTT